MQHNTALALTVTATFLWGCMGLCVRILEDAHLNSLDIALVRMGLTSVMMFLILLILDRDSLRFTKKQLPIFVFFGIAELLSEVFIFYSMGHIPLALATMLQQMSPFYVMFLSYLMFGEKIARKSVFIFGIAIIGCILATGMFEKKDIPIEAFGVLMAALSGFAYAAYVIGSKLSMDSGMTPQGTLFYIFTFGAIFSIPLADMGRISVAAADPFVLMNMFLLAFFMTLVPYYLGNIGIKVLGPTTATILSLMEIVFSAIVGYIFFEEVLTPLMNVGILVLMLSVVVMNIDYKELKNNVS